MSEFETRVYKDGVEICGVEGPKPTGDLVVPQTLPFKNDAGEVSQLPVLKIGDWAFEGCSSLKSITLPDGITEIGRWAFPKTTKVIRR